MNYKKFILFALSSILFFACSVKKHENINQNMTDFNFEKAWEKVNSLEKQGLAQTVFKKVVEIHEEALKSNNGEQIIKSLIYQGKYYQVVEEDGMIKSIEAFTKSLEKVETKEKAILQSLLAEMFDVYLSQNLWKFSERNELSDKKETDIRNWSPGQFIDHSTKLYLESVSHEGLDKIDVSEYEELIKSDEKDSGFRNSLYDILAHRALRYFKQEKSFLNVSHERFILKDESLFYPARTFVKLDLLNPAPSRELEVMRLFQKLTQTHLRKGNNAELLDLDLHRLIYLEQNFVTANKDELFKEGLLKLINENKDLDGVAEVYYRLANYYFQKEYHKYRDFSPGENYFQKAHEICEQSIYNYPDSYGADLCKSLKLRIEHKELRVAMEQVNLPGENLLAMIRYKNIDKVYLRVMEMGEKSHKDLMDLRQKDVADFIEDHLILDSWNVELKQSNDFRSHSTEIVVNPKEKGNYALVVSDHPDFDANRNNIQISSFFVSELAFWQTSDANVNYIYVVNRDNGKPLANVKVNLYEWDFEGRQRRRKLFNTYYTNNQGYISFKMDENRRKNYVVELETKDDHLFFDNSLYSSYSTRPVDSKSKILYFTDRSIYRPGQNVHFKGLWLKQDSKNLPHIIAEEKEVELSLYDVNGQLVDKITTVSNDFSTFSGSFSLPSSGLTGTFSIGSNRSNDRVYFNVEEYKRPQFSAKFNSYKKEYKLGDKIELSGKAETFSGVNIADAKVVYRIKRSSFFPYWNPFLRRIPFDMKTVEIGNGVTSTDEKGEFIVPVELLADDLIPNDFNPFFRYEIEADVVDLSGETHTARKTMSASWMRRNVDLNIAMESHVDSLVKVDISAKNWNGEDQGLKAKLEVFTLKTPQKVFRDRFWSKPDVWLYEKEEFNTVLPQYSFKNEDDPVNWESMGKEKEIDINTLEKSEINLKLSAGTYRVKLSFQEEGKEIELIKYCKVYDYEKPLPMHWMSFYSTGGEPGQYNVTNMVSAVNELPVLLEIFEEGKRIEHNWHFLSKKEELKKLIEEKHRGNFFVRTSYIYDNRIYSESKTIQVPWSNKELEFEYIHFRSELLPGSEEKWIVKVTGPNKDKIFGEMLASMYDASLDDIKMHNWNTHLYWDNYMNNPINYFGFGQANYRSFISRNWNEYYTPTKIKKYKDINWFGTEKIPGYTRWIEHEGILEIAPPQTLERMMSKRVANGEMDGSVPTDAASEPLVDIAMENEYGSRDENESTENQSSNTKNENPVRSNLNETVFFYPHLKTDEEGNVLIEFTMNEALTKWKFMGFAHTRDLKYAITSKDVVTKKEIMVQPNPPRFARMGDKLVFSASISNMTTNDLQGDVELELFNATNLQDISNKYIDKKSKSFEVKEKGRIVQSWLLDIPKGEEELLIYQVRAKSGKFTDGEEGYLPVLTNRILITETMPMWAGPNETKSYDFSALDKLQDKGLKSHKLTLEATSNPLWLAIQALPYIQDYSQKNSISLANALYANLLAAKIVEDNPAIKRVFEEWKKVSGKNNNSLQSNLMKNEELKSILINETPWLLEALDESAQKRNIAMLFEFNQIERDKRQILDILSKLQQHDGGYSWFSGGKSNEFMTLYILETIGKLKELGIDFQNEGRIRSMLNRALVFIDYSIDKRYRRLLERSNENQLDLEKDHLGQIDAYYLFVRSMYKDIKIQDGAREANVYYLNQAEKYWLNKGIYIQGLLAKTLQNRGNADVAKNILKSLLERSIYNEELGRYWKQYNGYHWSEFPIETQAMLIDAFNGIQQDIQSVNEMQLWLLKNKQNNRWKTAKASVAAIHALLINNQSQIVDTEIVELSIGAQSIKTEEVEAGTGYLKENISADKINASMKGISFKNPNEHIAWGAVYWQYFQDMDQVKVFEDTPLKIKREMFISVDGKKGEELVALKKKAPKQGDKLLVRISIEVDRPMDFIHLKDQKSGAVEGLEQLSQYHWNGGLFYYLSPKDSGTDIFIEHLPRGVFVIEYPVRVVHKGDFSSGLTTIQSMYAPEFSSHSEGLRLQVK